MWLLYLLSWWYGRGWGWALSSIFGKVRDINETFSIPILLRTWFAPWKQITTQATFRNFFQAAIDNLVSRFVGAAVRTSMIVGGALMSVFTILFGLFAAIAWPLVPVSIPGLIALF